MKVLGNHITTTRGSDEYASNLDLKIIGNDYTQLASPLDGFATQANSGCLLIDLGTAFFTAVANTSAGSLHGQFCNLRGVQNSQYGTALGFDGSASIISTLTGARGPPRMKTSPTPTC